MNQSEIARFPPRFTITTPIAAALTRIERTRAFLDAAKLSEEWLEAMRARALLLEAHHTTRMEGARLTLEQAELILAGRAVPEARPDDARGLLNYRDTFEFASSYLGEGGTVTEGLIREVHKRAMHGMRCGAAAPGEYRRVQGYVVNAATRQLLYAPPPAADVPALVRALVAWSHGEPEAHPVVVAAIVHFQLAHIHPFLEGSGLTSRLLAMLSLVRTGYACQGVLAISQYFDRNRTAFQRARQSARDAGMDVTGWLEFFAEGLATQLDEVRSRVEREARRDVVARHGLTERQAVAVRHILGEGSLTVADFERLWPGANRRTLQRELKQLVDRGLLRQTKARNRLQYLAGKKLA